MPAILQHNRGDIKLRKTDNLKNGQFFWSYVNEDPFSSEGHSYSRGQLWIKDPSSKEFTEIADRRSIDALRFQGFINHTFKGDFANAYENSQAKFKHCHVGDFWIFEETDKENFKYKFSQGDILLLTKTVYTEKDGEDFRQSLDSVDYIRIPGAYFDGENSDLEVDSISEALEELEKRLLYKGELQSLRDYYNKTQKKKGYMYIFRYGITLTTSELELPESRFTEESTVKVKMGDFIFWNGSKWVLIPAGTEDLTYIPNADEIDAVVTFTDYHKEKLKGTETVIQAIDLLNISKASLDSNGKIPLSELPDSVKNGLSIQGIFYPLINTYKEDTGPGNQNPWPIEIDADTKEPIEGHKNGSFWVVDCQGHSNIQYQDPNNPERIIELNTNDFIVWVEATGQFEIIDNSDRITEINVISRDETGTKIPLKGNIGITTDGLIGIKVKDNTIVISGEGFITSDPNNLGKKDYYPIYKDEVTLIPSEVHRVGDTTTFGDLNIRHNQRTYGENIVSKTPGPTATGFLNNSFTIENAFLTDKNEVGERYTRVYASEKHNYSESKTVDDVDVFLPEKDSRLMAIFTEDLFTKNYLPKSLGNDFFSDSLNSEIEYTDKYFKENYEEGFLNVGFGRTASEDIDTGEITFYAKSKDQAIYNAYGFFTKPHSFTNEDSFAAQMIEHFLYRDPLKVSRTHLVINPTVLNTEAAETFVKMPPISGTLLTWEDLIAIFGDPGVPLMIPAWEEQHFDVWDYVGLDTSPITIRLNRKKHGRTSVDRTNNLSQVYGTGKKSTFSYIHSSKEGSIQDQKRGEIDDVVTFDSWLEAQRSVATKEAFVLPSTSKRDGVSVVHPDTLIYKEDTKETQHDGYGKDSSGGSYQRILPSRTIYPDDRTYYDWHTGFLIPQDTTEKDVEMPAVGGVLLTTRSRIDCGFWADNL